MNCKVLLVVDDDAEMRALLRRILAPLGKVLEASNGPDALRLIQGEAPGLMLLDFAMPVMDGLAALRAAREIAPNMSVLMLTGDSDLSVIKRALAGGARAYITKPFEVESLLREVSRLLTIVEAPPDRPWSVRP